MHDRRLATQNLPRKLSSDDLVLSPALRDELENVAVCLDQKRILPSNRSRIEMRHSGVSWDAADELSYTAIFERCKPGTLAGTA